MTTSPFRFAHALRVRWGECDMQGIVFNPHYMAYVDVALTEYWRAVGLPYPAAFEAEGTDTFMVAASQTYRNAASFDDLLDVALRVDYLGTTSLRFAFDIGHDSASLVQGAATYVVADRQTRAPKPLSTTLVDCITRFEPVPPARKPAP